MGMGVVRLVLMLPWNPLSHWAPAHGSARNTAPTFAAFSPLLLLASETTTFAIRMLLRGNSSFGKSLWNFRIRFLQVFFFLIISSCKVGEINPARGPTSRAERKALLLLCFFHKLTFLSYRALCTVCWGQTFFEPFHKINSVHKWVLKVGYI